MNPKEDFGYGVKPFSIAGRTIDVRERCAGMTDEERRWRHQWLKDQILSENEPRFVPEYFRDTTNIFRRCWKVPMMKLENVLQPLVGRNWASHIRQTIGKGSICIAASYVIIYFLKYDNNDWCRSTSVMYHLSRKRMYPDDPNYPKYKLLADHEYFDNGFSSSPLCKKAGNVATTSSNNND